MFLSSAKQLDWRIRSLVLNIYGLEGANAALKCIKEIAEKEDFSCKRVDQSGLKDAAMIFQKRFVSP